MAEEQNGQQQNEETPQVRMRGANREALNESVSQQLQRSRDILQDGAVSEETEEIRKLDSQLDHLSDYVIKMEQRLKEHNERMMDVLKAQKEEREKRRRSFHERLEQNHKEDDAFNSQMKSIMNQVESHRNRASVYDMIKDMPIPETNGSA